MELESKLREKEMYIERLERDRRWLSDREAEEKAEKEKERLEREQEKVCLRCSSHTRTLLTLYLEEVGHRLTVCQSSAIGASGGACRFTGYSFILLPQLLSDYQHSEIPHIHP